MIREYFEQDPEFMGLPENLKMQAVSGFFDWQASQDKNFLSLPPETRAETRRSFLASEGFHVKPYSGAGGEFGSMREPGIYTETEKQPLIERGLSTIANLLGLPSPLATEKGISKGAKAMATVELMAKEKGVPLSQYRESPEFIEQFSQGFTDVATFGLMPALEKAIEGKEPIPATDVKGKIGSGLGSFAGLLFGPGKSVGTLSDKVLRRLPEATAEMPTISRTIKQGFRESLQLAPIIGAAEAGKAVQERSFRDAAADIGQGLKSGATTGAIFGTVKGLFPKEAQDRAYRIISGWLTLNAQRIVEDPEHKGPWDRPAEDVIFDTVMDTFFMYRGLPKEQFNKLADTISSVDPAEVLRKLEKPPEAAAEKPSLSNEERQNMLSQVKQGLENDVIQAEHINALIIQAPELRDDLQDLLNSKIIDDVGEGDLGALDEAPPGPAGESAKVFEQRFAREEQIRQGPIGQRALAEELGVEERRGEFEAGKPEYGLPEQRRPQRVIEPGVPERVEGEIRARDLREGREKPAFPTRIPRPEDNAQKIRDISEKEQNRILEEQYGPYYQNSTEFKKDFGDRSLQETAAREVAKEEGATSEGTIDADGFNWLTGELEKPTKESFLKPTEHTPWERQAQLEKEGVVKRPEINRKPAVFPKEGIKPGTAGEQKGLFGEEKQPNLFDQVKSTIKDQKGSITIDSKPYADLVRAGRRVIDEGHTKFTAFKNRMKEIFSESWDKIKRVMVRLFNDSKKLLKSEVGAITIPGKPNWETGDERPFSFDPNSTKNEGRYRLIHPNEFDSMGMGKSKFIYRSKKNGVDVPGIRFIVGKIKGKEQIQAIRFNKAEWTEEKAAEWWNNSANKFGRKPVETEQVKPEVKTTEQKKPKIPSPEEWASSIIQKAKESKQAVIEPEKPPEKETGPIPVKFEEIEDQSRIFTPGIEAILKPISEVKQGVESLVLPTDKSKEHLAAAEVLASKLGSMGRDAESANFKLKSSSRAFDRMRVHDPKIPLEDNPGIKFMSDMSQGRNEKDPTAVKVKALFSDRLQKLENAEVPLQQVRENYFPGMWTFDSRRAFNQAIAEAIEKKVGDPEKLNEWSQDQKKWIKNRVDELLVKKKGSDKDGLIYLTKKPFKGKESFRKSKVFDDIMTGVEFGLQPISNNPIDLVKLKLSEMDRSIMANRAIQEWKDQGDIQFLRSGKKMPEGFSKIDDKYGTVYGPPEMLMKEYVDKNIYDALSETAKNLGVKHERKASAGRGKLGYASQTGQVVTQFATELGIFGHEIGHVLDFKYNLWDKIVTKAEGIGKRGKVTKAASQKARAKIQKELRALADLTWEGKETSAYYKKKARKKQEKIAHILEAYTQAPDRLMEVAPNVHASFESFLKSIPELKPLKDIKSGISYSELQTKRSAGGFPVIGQWIAKQPVSDVLNNFLSSSLYNNRYFGKAYKTYMFSANALNQFQLGVFSAFHAGFTSLDVGISHVAEGMKDIYGVANGNRSFGDLKKTIGKIPLALLSNPKRGGKVVQEWNSPTMDIPTDTKIADLPLDNPTRIAMIAKAAELSGGGFKMERGLRTQLLDTVLRKWYGGTKGRIKLALQSPILFTELGAYPIMDWLVPRQKAGLFGELAGRIIEQNPDKALKDLRPEFRQAWNRVDARLGQVRYNRLFINNTAKNVIQGLVRAPGWTGGTIAEVGGSIKDTGKFVSDWIKTGEAPKNIPDRVAYTLALFTVTALINGTLTYVLTGDKPKGTDYWAFRTGGKDEYGRDERMLLPSYMKDIWAYSRNAPQTIIHKTHPMISLIGDIVQNRDYYGVRVYNKDDPFIKRQIQKGEYVLKEFVPFWIRGVQRETERGGGLMETLKKSPQKVIAPEFGIMPAPSSYIRSKFEDYVFKTNLEKNKGTRTKEQFERSTLKRQLEIAVRRKDPGANEKIRAAAKEHKINRSDIVRIKRLAKQNPIVTSAKSLSLNELAYGIQYATDEEKELIRPIFKMKFSNKLTREGMSKEDRKRYREILKSLSRDRLQSVNE